MIGLAGDLSRAEAEALARTLLPPALEAPPAPTAPALPPPSAPDRRPAEMNVKLARLTQTYFAFAREGPALTDRE